MLTLDNFDQELPKDLLKKAQPYVKNGAVVYLDQNDDGGPVSGRDAGVVLTGHSQSG